MVSGYTMDVHRISLMTRLFVLMTLYVVAYAKHKHYAGWKSYYVQPNTEEQVKSLNAIRKKLDLDFLNAAHIRRESVVLVTPKQQKEFIKTLDHLGIKYWIHVDDVKSALDHDDQVNENMTKSAARQGGEFLSYKSYERWDKINAYLDYIVAKYPEFTNLVTFLHTSEGRPIKYLRISTTKFKDVRKPIIIIEGGMHGREWLSPPTVTWAIRKLTEDVTEPDLVNLYDWILMPVANPDGYVHSFSGMRFWRKNRSKSHPNNHFCPGVDTNRNFDIAWNTSDTESLPCSLTYPGIKPFSEKESIVIRQVLRKRQSRVALYLSMHSYGSMLLYPWAYTSTHSQFQDALYSVGRDMADAIFHRNRPILPKLTVGNTAQLLYECSGTSTDYAHFMGVPLVYIFELPGVTTRRISTATTCRGFHLDPQYISDVCRATWSGITVGARSAKRRFDFHFNSSLLS